MDSQEERSRGGPSRTAWITRMNKKLNLHSMHKIVLCYRPQCYPHMNLHSTLTIATKLLLPADWSLARAQGSSGSRQPWSGVIRNQNSMSFEEGSFTSCPSSFICPTITQIGHHMYIYTHHPVRCSSNHLYVFSFLFSFHAQASLNTATAINVPALK